MIIYKNTITVSEQRTGQWRIDTDRGDQYQLTQINGQKHPLTDWWSMQHQSELRGWQMDVFVKELTRRGYGDDYVIWLAHKAGAGHSQPHDIVIMYHTGMQLWVLSTAEDHWLQPGAMITQQFKKDHEDTLHADLLNPQDRQEVYKLIDFYNQYYDQKDAA
jgi:hypothetical protein